MAKHHIRVPARIIDELAQIAHEVELLALHPLEAEHRRRRLLTPYLPAGLGPEDETLVTNEPPLISTPSKEIIRV